MPTDKPADPPPGGCHAVPVASERMTCLPAARPARLTLTRQSSPPARSANRRSVQTQSAWWKLARPIPPPHVRLLHKFAVLQRTIRRPTWRSVVRYSTLSRDSSARHDEETRTPLWPLRIDHERCQPVQHLCLYERWANVSDAAQRSRHSPNFDARISLRNKNFGPSPRVCWTTSSRNFRYYSNYDVGRRPHAP